VTAGLAAGVRVAEARRGVDSGITVPLHFLLPTSRVPVVPLSLADRPPDELPRLGRGAAPHPERPSAADRAGHRWLLSDNEHAFGLRRDVPAARDFDERMLEALRTGAWPDVRTGGEAEANLVQPQAGLRHLQVLRGVLGRDEPGPSFSVRVGPGNRRRAAGVPAGLTSSPAPRAAPRSVHDSAAVDIPRDWRDPAEHGRCGVPRRHHLHHGTRPHPRAGDRDQGRKVLSVGREETVQAYIGPDTKIEDLAGAYIVPGLIDAHGHMMNLGNLLSDVDLTGTTSYQQVIQRVVERAKTTPKGDWIVGRGWDQNDWTNTSMPVHHGTVARVPDHPVRLTRVDGHASLVNAMAMQRAHLTRATKAPAGGAILHGKDGQPTGVLVDNARNLIESVIPPLPPAEIERRLMNAMQECARLGLTMVHDAGIGVVEWRAYHALMARGPLPIRIYAMASARDACSTRCSPAARRSAISSRCARSRSTPMVPWARGERCSASRTPTRPKRADS
jgi:hypothetical protein